MHDSTMDKQEPRRKTERPARVQLSTEEVLKRMQEFPERREQFLAAVRSGDSSSYLAHLIKTDGTIQRGRDDDIHS